MISILFYFFRAYIFIFIFFRKNIQINLTLVSEVDN